MPTYLRSGRKKIYILIKPLKASKLKSHVQNSLKAKL